MSHTFTKLHDLVVVGDLLESSLDVCRQLHETTEEFFSLSQRAQKIATTDIVDIDTNASSNDQTDADATTGDAGGDNPKASSTDTQAGSK